MQILDKVSSSYYFFFYLGYLSYWTLTIQMTTEEGREPYFFISITSSRSQTLRYLFPFMHLRCPGCLLHTAQKMKFCIKDFFSKCDQIPSFLWIWSHLLKKSLTENFIFCAVSYNCKSIYKLYKYKSIYKLPDSWWDLATSRSNPPEVFCEKKCS